MEKRTLLAYFHDPESLFRGTDSNYRAAASLSEEALAALACKDLAPARALAETCRRKHIGIVALSDSGYPARLRQIPDPPLVLYYRGQLPDWEAYPAIGVVGTRRATSYGLQMAATLGAQLAACGGLVVSGMATGVDAQAMEGALSQDMPVVGVLGSGPDVVYPKANRALYEKTVANGCVLSEYPPGTPGYKWNFPRRNRIISGISHGVLVVQAPEGSGALITAREALQQGREVFVVPGNISTPEAEGSNRLLREGAAAVFEGYDVLEEYADRFAGRVRRAQPHQPVRQQTQQKETEDPTPAKLPKKPIDKEEKSHYSVLNNRADTMTAEEKALASLLRTAPIPVDEVIAQSGLSAAKALSVLTNLCLKGVIRYHPGKQVSLNEQ